MIIKLINTRYDNPRRIMRATKSVRTREIQPMKSTLAETLPILLPDLSPELVAPEAIPPLQKTARFLAPIPRGGFECRHLEQVGWQGATDELERLMEALYAHVDRITVCLDVGCQIYPKVGLECILLKQPPQEPRWNSFLAYLVERGCCTSEKQAALLKWPGQTNPTTTEVPWQSHLITASLLQPLDRFSVFVRRLSHIKIVYQPQRWLEAICGLAMNGNSPH